MHADETLGRVLELEAAVKVDWSRDTNWVLFDPNDLRRFAQQKGGFMNTERKD